MSQIIAQAGQLVIRQAAGLAPQIAGAAANSAVNAAQNLIFGPIKRRSAGPRREEVRIQTASEGAAISRVYGRQRVAGQILWVTPLKETTSVTRASTGGKGVRRTVEQEHTEYLYSASIAIGLCEGEISRIARIWADGNLLPSYDYSYRVYQGTEDQLSDPLIEAVEGVDNAPSYRGLAYVVFEDLPLAAFGNRIPQFNFEVERQIPSQFGDSLEETVRAVTLIPGSGEAVYNTKPILEELEEGVTRAQNAHSSIAQTDIEASLDHLQASLPNVDKVSLIVSWFASDLRADQCQIEPRIEVDDKTTVPEQWAVNNYTRANASLVSRLPNGEPAFGGTPSDEGVRQAIRELKSRANAVTFYPFILVDVPPENTLPDPLGAAAQPAYPWRGRITVSPRISVDKSVLARTQIDNFFAQYRPMILHYAQLCSDEGGVAQFLIGSELRALMNVRDQNNAFPAVEAMVALAADVRAILGPATEISYAADWSEYSNYRPNDGSGDVYFHLDALWADQNIDFIGIDNYMPISDWRDGKAHLDLIAGHSTIYDFDYLQSGIDGGEGYDWFYASDADRANQIRTPIIDNAYGEDWVFRYKDLWSWWGSSHTDRPSGVKASNPTAFVAQSKPIVFTELGCAATDYASNQPNVFYDPKSSESARPYFSSGARDDAIQRRFIEAHTTFWLEPENNPVSSVYGAEMVRSDQLFIYTWDARPFPDFPVRGSVWADAENWVFGHWLNGRAGKIPLGALIEHIAKESNMNALTAAACTDLVAGFHISGPMSARDAIETLVEFYQLDSVERAGTVIISPRQGVPIAVRDEADFVDDNEGRLVVVRNQERSLPKRLSVGFSDGFSDYQSAVVNAEDPSAISDRTIYIDTAIVLEEGEAIAHAEAILAEARTMQTKVQFGLAANDLLLEPADVITLTEGATVLSVRITEILDGPFRRIEGVVTDEGLYTKRYRGLRGTASSAPLVPGPPVIAIMDLPILPDGEDGAFLRSAAFAQPWPGQVSVHRGAGADAPRLGVISKPSIMGKLTMALPSGPVARWDEGSVLAVKLSGGGLSSLTRTAVLNGAGRAAIEVSAGQWEVLSFARAVLDPTGVWLLSELLRGQRGTEAETKLGAPVGARFVLLDNAQITTPITADALGLAEVWQAGPASRAPGEFPFREAPVTLSGHSLRPFAPVHMRAQQAGTDYAVSWIRRTRIGGDNWSAIEVPLGETAENYRVEGRDGTGALIVSLATNMPSATLPAANIVEIAVAQVSDLYGIGRYGVLPV